MQVLQQVASWDKSVQQAQMLELPFNKLLVLFGQNEVSRRIVILDVDRLYEKDRFENFQFGLTNVSTQTYVKSNLGGFRGFSGHCAYNRTDGAMLVPDPSGNYKEVLQICRVDDERLVYKKQGVVWNFPATNRGIIETELSVIGSGVRISVTDRWLNPADEYIKEEAYASFEVTSKSDWRTITVEFDTESAVIKITDGENIQFLTAKGLAPNGLCYLHIQTLAEKQDFEGTLIRSFKKTDLC